MDISVIAVCIDACLSWREWVGKRRKLLHGATFTYETCWRAIRMAFFRGKECMVLELRISLTENKTASATDT